ncbi:Hypothetical protein SCLAV_p0351 (plasmid) [Streptomyces clavuligerus]|uniref:Uncharacterized protein n=1 Tax=Streptomyces clavuligerus TaxID=1901 RepID=D5SIU9_STRCL|nr:Hypothetical protein SCLAV_p0351 [Streptomyces clavuligerus]
MTVLDPVATVRQLPPLRICSSTVTLAFVLPLSLSSHHPCAEMVGGGVLE